MEQLTDFMFTYPRENLYKVFGQIKQLRRLLKLQHLFSTLTVVQIFKVESHRTFSPLMKLWNGTHGCPWAMIMNLHHHRLEI